MVFSNDAAVAVLGAGRAIARNELDLAGVGHGRQVALGGCPAHVVVGDWLLGSWASVASPGRSCRYTWSTPTWSSSWREPSISRIRR